MRKLRQRLAKMTDIDRSQAAHLTDPCIRSGIMVLGYGTCRDRADAATRRTRVENAAVRDTCFPPSSLRASPPERMEVKKTFRAPGGRISSQEENLYYVVKRAASSQNLVSAIKQGTYVLIHGLRMCGKSTRVTQLIQAYQNEFRGL